MTDVVDSVLVTGCSSGIGRATAEAFQDRGWSVYATARSTEDVASLEAPGLRSLELDVTVDEHCRDAVATVREETGGIGCLVNNAGYGAVATVEDTAVEELHAQLDVNTYGPQRLMTEAIPHMRAAGGGTIVNVSSVGGRLPQPGLGAYCASKFALEALSDAARAELRSFGVDVVLVEPGPVRTNFSHTADEDIQTHRAEEGPYRALYDRIAAFNDGIVDRGTDGLLSGLMGAATIPPAQVADVIVSAAEAEEPRPRYAPSLPHRLMALGRLVPARLRDRAFNAVV